MDKLIFSNYIECELPINNNLLDQGQKSVKTS